MAMRERLKCRASGSGFGHANVQIWALDFERKSDPAVAIGDRMEPSPEEKKRFTHTVLSVTGSPWNAQWKWPAG
jgi:hypothetical protein